MSSLNLSKLSNSGAATPRLNSGAATPRLNSGAATPRLNSGAATPRLNSGAATPRLNSGAATPRLNSGAATPRLNIPNTVFTPNLQRRHENYFKKGKQVVQIQASPEEINEYVKNLTSSGYKNIRVTKHDQNSNLTQITYTTPKASSNHSALPSTIQMNLPLNIKPVTLKRKFNNVTTGGKRKQRTKACRTRKHRKH